MTARQMAAFLTVVMLCAIAAVGISDSKTSMVGRRYECMYYVKNGEKKLITDPSERPYVEFLSDRKCIYKDGADDNTWMVGGNNKILVVEAGIFPMLSFEAVANGCLKLDGVGLMLYSLDEYDNMYYNTSSEEYARLSKEAENLRIEEEATKGSLGKLEHITSIYPFRNGYACAKDNEGIVHYFDANGSIVFENKFPMISNKVWAIDHGVTLDYDREKEAYVLIDMEHNVLKEFKKSDHKWIGVPSGGYIGVEHIRSTLSGNSTDVVYYDASGAQAFAFSDVQQAQNGLSNFMNGRAYVKDSDRQFWLIDTGGNKRNLSVSNKELIISEAEQEYRGNGYTSEHYFEISTIEIKSVTPFVEEQFSSAYVESNVSVKMMGKYGWDDFTYRLRFAAAVDRNGSVTLLGRSDEECPPCKYGIILAERNADNYGTEYNGWYVPSTGAYIDLKVLPELNAAKNISAVYLDDGNLLVTMNNGSGTRFFAVVDRHGKLLSGPTRDENGLTYNYTMMQDPYEISNYMESGTILNTVDSNLIWNDKATYINVKGEKIAQGTVGTKFQNGYAIVALSSSSVQYVNVGEEVTFIDKTGQAVDSIVLPQEESHYGNDRIQAQHNYSKNVEMAKNVLNTDGQFRYAFSTTIPNVVGGEILGYMYDCATLDPFALIEHIGSDVTKEYRKNAARAIERSLLSGIQVEDAEILLDALSEALKNPVNKTVKDINKAAKKIIKGTNLAVQNSNYPEDELKVSSQSVLDKMLNSIDLLSTLIDAADTSLENKAIVAVLVSNYEENKEYVEKCIDNARKSGNSELEAIYQLVLDDLENYYKAYIEGATKYIALQGIDFITMKTLVSGAKWTTKMSGVKISMEGYVNNKYSGKALGRANLLLLVHEIVVETSKALGTNAYYEGIQKLYEDAIVINALVEEFSGVLQEYMRSSTGADVENLKKKAITLAEYRILVIGDLINLCEKNSAVRDMLNSTEMTKAQIELQTAIEYFTSM